MDEPTTGPWIMQDRQVLAQLICWVTMGELHTVHPSLPPSPLQKALAERGR